MNPLSIIPFRRRAAAAVVVEPIQPAPEPRMSAA